MAKYINKPKRKTSKKNNTIQRKNVDKKVKQHKRKMKKEAQKMKALGIFKRKAKKDMGLPNLYPYKAQVLESLARKKEEKEKEAKMNKLKNKELVDLAKAVDRTNQFEKDLVESSKDHPEDAETLANESSHKEKRKYMKELRKVLEASDIVLEVLDARDPMGCRCKDIEAKIQGMAGDKKIILVLNKIDLVPIGNSEAWLKHLRREYATVLFKANTQQQNTHLSQNTLFKKSLKEREDLAQELLSTNKAVGAENLLQLIKNYSKNDGVKQAVTVGVIGYPNVGKSSLINSLKKSKAAGVSSTPGFTKNMQEIQIDKKVTLLDCPGIIFSEEGEKSLVLRNIIKVENVNDPIGPIEEILKKAKKNELLVHYKIPDFSTPHDFLVNVAMARGKLNKGGIPDLENAARVVLADWNTGKIKFFTIPPNPEEKETMEEEEEKI